VKELILALLVVFYSGCAVSPVQSRAKATHDVLWGDTAVLDSECNEEQK